MRPSSARSGWTCRAGRSTGCSWAGVRRATSAPRSSSGCRRSAWCSSGFPATLLLTGTASALIVLVAIPLGVLSAVFRDKWVDYVSSGLALIGQAAPNFWLGFMLILLFAVHLRWLPTSGRGTPCAPGAAGTDPCAPAHRQDRPPHALGDAGGAGRPLRAHRPCQGRGARAGDARPRAEERLSVDRDRARARYRLSARRGDHRGDGVQLAGPRPPGHRGHQQP